MATKFDDLPDDALIRRPDFLRTKDSPGVVGCSRTKWQELVDAGIAPAPKYPIGESIPLWRVGDLRAYLRKLNQAVDSQQHVAA
jgi:hypothetical protein